MNEDLIIVLAVIDALKRDGLINDALWYQMIIELRKLLKLPIQQ